MWSDGCLWPPAPWKESERERERALCLYTGSAALKMYQGLSMVQKQWGECGLGWWAGEGGRGGGVSSGWEEQVGDGRTGWRGVGTWWKDGNSLIWALNSKISRECDYDVTVYSITTVWHVLYMYILTVWQVKSLTIYFNQSGGETCPANIDLSYSLYLVTLQLSAFLQLSYWYCAISSWSYWAILHTKASNCVQSLDTPFLF